MNAVINRNEAPSHLFNIPELDFREDLFAERLGDQWFRLGAQTITCIRDGRGVEDVISRQSLLLAPGCFADIFDNLESIGNVIGDLGKPGGSVPQAGWQGQDSYSPFHRFEFPFSSAVGEPLVFVHSAISGIQLFINPDLWLFFELEEKTRGEGVWWDSRRGVEALRQRVIEQGKLEIVEFRVEYLRKYLQARQMSLIVGHYRHLHLFDPLPCVIEKFVKEDVMLGSPDEGVKAILQNWGLRQDIPGAAPFLQRRLHLWFEIRPPEIYVEVPWTNQSPFDPYAFTLPTRVGPVAPARWAQFQPDYGRNFEGEVCNFMAQVYFRQEVLTKYEGASGFDIVDDGSVRCHHYWGLVRSTSRIGNELLATAIGDFAQGVPFEEWQHWKQYAVELPSPETLAALREEQTVPDAINSLVQALYILNAAFACMAASLHVENLDPLWRGSLDSMAGRQLKWVYPATADDDEFLKRVTLASTLVIDELKGASLRKLLKAIDGSLHLKDRNPPQTLGSRNLLQRVTIIAVLIENLLPEIKEIPLLVKQAEGKVKCAGKPDLKSELEMLYNSVRDEFAPLAFLYELRTYGGLAHPPNKDKAADAAANLGLSRENWHRTDYLRLLNLIENSVHQISRHLNSAAQVMPRGGLSETT